MSPDTRAMRRDAAIAEAFELYKGRLMSTIRRRTRDSAEAEDVLQDVYTEFITTYDLNSAIDVVIESVGAWLARVAQNKILDRFRRRRTETNYRDRTVTAEGSKDDRVKAELTPDDEFTRTYIRKELIAAIDQLPDEQREVFVMHELEGKTFEEMSAKTGVSLNTLLARKRYAVLALREHLKEVYDELE